MKQELTFAVVLLALGGAFLIFNLGADKKTNSAAIPNDLQSANQQAKPTLDAAGNSTDSIALASFQDDSTQSHNEGDQNRGTNNSEGTQQLSSNKSNSNPELASLAVSQAGFDIRKTDPHAVTLLATAARQISNSKPFKSAFSLRAESFGQNVVASGAYFQMGQGTHKTRIEMVFDSIASKPTLTQICDGRFFYTARSEERSSSANQRSLPQKTLEFVDLQRIQEAAGERPTQLTPTGWVATGGLSSLLQHLTSGFNFGPPSQLENSMTMIRGVWDPIALRQIISDPDAPPLEGSVKWEDVPKQLPHAVEFIFSNNNGAYFPSQVSFLRFDAKTGQAVPTMILNLSNPSPLSNLADGFFVIDSNNLKPTDATDRYIARIESFQQTQQAAKESTTLDR